MPEALRRTAVVAAAMAIFAAGCGGGSDDTTTETIGSDITAILDAAATSMGEVDTVRFTIERAGAPVFIDLGDELGDLLEFKSADGFFAGPSSAEALVTVSVSGFNTRVGAVAIDGQIWLSFVTGTWQPAPPSYTFDPASLFDPHQGFRQLFIDGLTGVTLVGTEDRDGTPAYHIRGNAGEKRVEAITAGLVRNQGVVLDAWIDQGTGRLVDAFFTTNVTGGTAEWTMTFREYGAEVTVDPPDLGAGG